MGISKLEDIKSIPYKHEYGFQKLDKILTRIIQGGFISYNEIRVLTYIIELCTMRNKIQTNNTSMDFLKHRTRLDRSTISKTITKLANRNIIEYEITKKYTYYFYVNFRYETWNVEGINDLILDVHSKSKKHHKKPLQLVNNTYSVEKTNDEYIKELEALSTN